MASFQVVLLLVAVYVCFTSAQINPFQNFGPSAGGAQSFGPFGGGGGGGGAFFDNPHMLTCIGTNEALDHLKVTIRPEPRRYSSRAFQYGDPLSRISELVKRDWRISVVYIPASNLGVISPAGTNSLVGQFFLAVTRYGRTDGSCAGMGGILQDYDTINIGSGRGRGSPFPGSNPIFGGNPYLGGNPFLRSPFSGQQGPQLPFGPQGSNPFSSFFGAGGGSSQFSNPRSQIPPGFIQDPIVISRGGNVYTGVIRDLSEADLRGRGMSVCLDHLCQRPTTTCCGIVEDSTPATETVGVVTTGPVNGYALTNPTAGFGAGSLPTAGGLPTGGLTGGNPTNPGTGTGSGGLF